VRDGNGFNTKDKLNNSVLTSQFRKVLTDLKDFIRKELASHNVNNHNSNSNSYLKCLVALEAKLNSYLDSVNNKGTSHNHPPAASFNGYYPTSPDFQFPASIAGITDAQPVTELVPKDTMDAGNAKCLAIPSTYLRDYFDSRDNAALMQVYHKWLNTLKQLCSLKAAIQSLRQQLMADSYLLTKAEKIKSRQEMQKLVAIERDLDCYLNEVNKCEDILAYLQNFTMHDKYTAPIIGGNLFYPSLPTYSRAGLPGVITCENYSVPTYISLWDELMPHPTSIHPSDSSVSVPEDISDQLCVDDSNEGISCSSVHVKNNIYIPYPSSDASVCSESHWDSMDELDAADRGAD